VTVSEVAPEPDAEVLLSIRNVPYGRQRDAAAAAKSTICCSAHLSKYRS
jgi:hypothetical protein